MKKSTLDSARGQVAIEYMLLFSLALILAIAISSQLVSRDPNQPGALITKWIALREWIAKDDPGKR